METMASAWTSVVKPLLDKSTVVAFGGRDSKAFSMINLLSGNKQTVRR